ncbi:hypothetical protein ACGFY9_27925 [Streptomyces sp. NPDC048504]|uniref:hypothetical protein n=1 Tax=Streptomyces sp. NPDC048504 TaxID=3365559 RepID=UPI0037146D4C
MRTTIEAYWVSWWDETEAPQLAHSVGVLIAGLVGNLTLAPKEPVGSASTEESRCAPAAVAVVCG